MNYLIEFAMFAGKTIIIVGGTLVVISALASLAIKGKKAGEKLEVESLNKKYKQLSGFLKSHILNKKDLKKDAKTEKKKEKANENKKASSSKVFVLNFEGDIKASGVENLRDEISAVLSVAQKNDEVVVSVESGGGMVHSYGLAASQLARVRKAGVKLTICVDKIAASGGYMMACTGDQILAAPFAILGSIGVLAQVPNFNKLLKKHDVDYQEITAGEYKRTLSIFGEVTEKGKAKFTDQIIDTHMLFKSFVKEQRPILDVDKVGTGEYWYGKRALELKLCDQIITSDEYLFSLKDEAEIMKISTQAKKKLGDKLSDAFGKAFEASIEKLIYKSRFFL